jgi:hypothetical protein
MSKYKIIGDYTIHDNCAETTGDIITVRIPFTFKNGTLKYGIANVLNSLKQKDIYPTEDGFDIIALAALVYLADTRISRKRHAEDSWTREIAIELPVCNLEKWSPHGELFAQMLNFLTGDHWTTTFSKREISLTEDKEHKAKYDAISLFSGGMDSLIGIINHLERKHKVALISHASDGYTKDAQKSLLSEFKEKYPKTAPDYFSLWMSFEKDMLLDGGIENSTRSRSFLFIAFGIFALSGMDGINVLQVPENGLIALNVPLDTLRVGSYSTRTTHPFYMNLWNNVLSELDLPFSVDNPYWNKTKGEMADECLNKNFLLQAIKESTSCSSPQKVRWIGQPAQHCGYCVPCLIRRAAIHKAYGLINDTTTYSIKSLVEIINAHAKNKGEQLRSFQVAIKRIIDNPDLRKILIYKNGRLDRDSDYIEQLSGVYYRGLLEVNSFINSYLKFENGNKEK